MSGQNYRSKGFPAEFCTCSGSCGCGKPLEEDVRIAMRLDAEGNLAPEMGQALCGLGWSKVTAVSYDYKHVVDTCPCGTCYKARVDSGTEDAYKRAQEAATSVKTKPQPEASAKATTNHPDGSACPHGLPFYVCLPCAN